MKTLEGPGNKTAPEGREEEVMNTPRPAGPVSVYTRRQCWQWQGHMPRGGDSLKAQ